VAAEPSPRGVWAPRGEVGATPPPPSAPCPCPAGPCGAAPGCGSGFPERLGVPARRLTGAEPPPHLHLHEGAAVEAAGGGGQGTPQAAPLGHGGSGRPGARSLQGAAAGGAGEQGPTGLGTGCACLSAARLPHRLVGGGAGWGGGETPPSSRPGEGRGGGHCSSLCPPPAPSPWAPALQSRTLRAA
jgi:hypothetical protein